MVMHARKISRLNDGYYERGQPHPFEDTKSSRSGRHHNERNPEKGRTSPSYRYRERDDSPTRSNPRYANKSYHDKNKGQGRMERGGSEKHSGGASTSEGRRVEGTRTNNTGHNHKDLHKDTVKDSKKRDEVQKSAVRTCGDWSEHISSIGKRYYYNCKTEVSKWEKPREWKDSEAVECNTKPSVKSKSRDSRLSSGSKGVADERIKHSKMDRPSDRQAHNKLASSSFGSPAPSRDRHGNSQNSASHNPPSVIGGGSRPFSTPPSRQTACSAVNSLPQSSHDRDKQRPPQLSQPKMWQNQQDNHHPSHLHLRESCGGPSLDRSLSQDGYGPMGYNDRRRDCGNPSNLSSLPSSSGYHTGTPTHSTNNSADFNGAKPGHHSNQDEGQVEVDMDISPGSTPTEESRLEKSLPSLAVTTCAPTPNACTPHIVTSTPPLANNSGGTTPRSSTANTPTLSTVLPQVLQQLGIETLTQLNSISGNKSFSVTQAIQTLQKLQQVLIVQQQQQQQRKLQQIVQQLQAQLAHQQQPQHSHQQKGGDPSQSPYSPPDESDGTPLQSPEYVPNSIGGSHGHNNDEDASNSRSRESPRRGSPTPSHSSSQSAAVAALAASHRKQETFQLTPSLANYYKDSLVDHVSGWQADLYERQASHYSEEAHTVGSLHCSQVSVELKRARSLVRVGEIQATLQEQRILFIRQQIKDLENWRTQNTFMPSTTLPSSSQKDT